MLKFYYGSGSPFAWRVWLALEHKRIPHELVTISFSAREHKTPEYLAVNPRGKVPAIVDDGFCLYEAAVIVEYLDERSPGEPWLFPRELRARAETRRLIKEADEYLAPFQVRMARQLFFTKPENWDLDELAAMREKMLPELVHYERVLSGDFLTGELSAADFTVYPLLAVWRRFELRKPDVGLLSEAGPKVRAWMARIEALPHFDNTYPPHWRQS